MKECFDYTGGIHIMVEQCELMRRLKLVREIRLNYINKYNISEDEISFNYSLLPDLDKADYVIWDKDGMITWGKIVHEKTITHWDPYKDVRYNTGEQQSYWGDSEVVHGNFIERCASLYYRDLLNDNFSDDLIHQKEKENFDSLLRFIIYSLNEKIKGTKSNIEKETERMAKYTQRLSCLNETII